MTLRSSPTTSEMARQTVGPAAAAASRPPLTADRCLRIVLSAVISAPPFSRALTAVRLSSSVRAPAGTAIKADAPPESSTTRVSPGSVRSATSIARRPAATLRASGSGWLDGIHSSGARQRNRQVSADDNAVANPIAGNPRECVGHERRGLADGNDAQTLAMQARCDRRILYARVRSDGVETRLRWRRGRCLESAGESATEVTSQ